MPKRKPSGQPVPRPATPSKSSTRSTAAKSPKRVPSGVKTGNPPAKKRPLQNPQSEEYNDYLERYELYGEGRPHLSPSEYDRLDEEMLDLLASETEQGILNDDQIVRLQELEYLLLDSEQ